ncbi:NADPH-dependent 7-cyano-7-deazaguanine reductase QueF [Luteimonas sp. MC1825]|uniref:NADPH-dependent 7-cyano-7-deazaguanine reductase QueF n=1 Tax=Luteimonas sp. MC1825 TaxID=2761107 RepID=UPI00161C56BB|nr:NADPH-dependent 7-cyano-7-deazaguanine reductase QueF [Luteimonas sp. MC1825]MBB6600524.1 NADPH-dependent 7-cyano-7-deazaguanine reductase QueF [Luteimonas sp. MC1825]QOC88182.1 NADPH-dependent 7-cyano-7-deazaguanine reductase QueF [Luteimonas sp. MC1825]
MTIELPLGREVAYPRVYDATLLFPIARDAGRAALGIGATLPFDGHDRWQAYELSWLDARGKPAVATATFLVPAASPRLIESKSLKLYLNSFNGTRFADAAEVHARITTDLSAAAGAAVAVGFGLPPMATASDDAASIDIDGVDVAIDAYDHPAPELLACAPGQVVEETLRSQLLKSNCPVTGQPDWASVRIAYRGPRIDRAALLRYLVSFREHAGFHEQCAEQVFVDLMAQCSPQQLSVEARYTRRGGLDINPWRATPGLSPPAARRDPRQ